MAGKVLQIVDWDKNFENAATRKIKTKMKAFLCPNKYDGDGYTSLVDRENGTAYYGAWIGIVGQASKSTPRGILMRDNGEPHTPATLSRMLRMPEALLKEAIEVLCSKEVLWLEFVPIDSIEVTESPTLPVSQPDEVVSETDGVGSLKNQTKPNQIEPNRTQPKGKPGGDYVRLEDSVLRDDHKLDSWFRWAAGSKKYPKIKAIDTDKLFVFGCAERAIEKGDNPVGLFITLVRDRLENISDAQDQRAQNRIKNLRGPPKPHKETHLTDAGVEAGLSGDVKTHQDKLRNWDKNRKSKSA